MLQIKYPSFIRPYHVEKKSKAILYKEMISLYSLGTIKEGFFSIFKSHQLSSRKVTKDKRAVIDLSYLHEK